MTRETARKIAASVEQLGARVEFIEEDPNKPALRVTLVYPKPDQYGKFETRALGFDFDALAMAGMPDDHFKMIVIDTVSELLKRALFSKDALQPGLVMATPGINSERN